MDKPKTTFNLVRVAEFLGYWIARHNLGKPSSNPGEFDAEMVVRFKSPRERSAAIQAFKGELPFEHQGNYRWADDSLTVDGIKVRFEAKPWGQE